ncbi:MAG: agmatine deiminase family protein [Ignavibacteria bacterium]|nr:agmatine deiminase family protein [Ignavibacteria bacterium]
MRIIPEYEPVGLLYLSFVQKFFNSRFKFGKAICEIAKVASRNIDVEIFIAHQDVPYLKKEMEDANLDSANIIFNYDSPERGILAEYTPIFWETTEGKGGAIIFNNTKLNSFEKLHSFSERLSKKLNLNLLDIEVEFTTSAIIVNENLCLLSKDLFQDSNAERKLLFFQEHFSEQTFVQVPSLAEEVTPDLDTYLWPIKPNVWIVSEYPEGSMQAVSIEPAIETLHKYNQTIHRVPGLERIVYDDINTIPNYTNGIIINNAALCPAYNRPEDDIIVKILEEYGYDVYPINCQDIILTQCGIHCISKSVPKKIITSDIHQN